MVLEHNNYSYYAKNSSLVGTRFYAIRRMIRVDAIVFNSKGSVGLFSFDRMLFEIRTQIRPRRVKWSMAFVSRQNVVSILLGLLFVVGSIQKSPNVLRCVLYGEPSRMGYGLALFKNGVCQPQGFPFG
jgi:hypothetical protein